MDPHCLRHTELPGTSRLFEDFLYHFDRLAEFYFSSPFDPHAYLQAASQVSYPADRRQALVAALREINPASPLLDRLAQPDAVAVVTGQQVGLYGGPCYTFYKALTAVSIAKQLNGLGRVAVPVFWLATEDHDFAEIDHAWVHDAAMNPAKLSGTGNGQPQQPVGGIELTSADTDRLRGLLAGFAHGEEIADLAARAYLPGRTFGEAFHELVRSVLGPHAVLFVDPLSPKIREIAAPFLAQAAARQSELSAAVHERTQQLVAAGYHAQVLVETPDAPLFFQLDGNRRLPVKKNPEAVEPTNLSPNALLRPVLQDYLLPTAVMIGGPAEIAYLAQSAPLYDALLGRRPALTARAGFTLLDAHAAKLMDRYQLRIPDLLQPREAFRQTLADRLAPPALRAAFDAAIRATGARLDELGRTISSFDPTLAASLAKSRAKIEYQLEKSRAKLAREMLRREQRASADADYLANLIYPHRHPQERFYSILPFLAQHGPGLIGRVYENIHVSCPDHHVLPL
jgi:uncharacterized protein YllA (UPF0747 family)